MKIKNLRVWSLVLEQKRQSDRSNFIFLDDNDEGSIILAQLAGQVYDLMNQPKEANTSYQTALTMLEKRLKEQPEDPRIYSSIGIVRAGLGRKEDAIREEKLAVELYPVLKKIP